MIKTSVSRLLRLVWSATAIAIVPAMSWAQDSALVIDEIIVTAEKRETSLQNVPLAVTALMAESLDRQNVTRTEDLNALVPGLTITQSEGFKRIVVIRGLGNEANQNDASNPAVSMHLDGVYLANELSANTAFLDVERIEVLRGPQGTVFGQNSTGGTINVISNAPSTDGVEGKFDVTVGNYETAKFRGAFNVPLSDTVAVRAAVAYNSHEGYAKNVALNGFELDEENSFIGRVQLLWAPTDSFSATLRAQFADQDDHGPAQRSISDPSGDKRLLTHDYEDLYAWESTIYSASLRWDRPWGTIKSVTSYQDEAERSSRDNDRSNFTALSPPPNNNRNAIVTSTGRAPKSFTQEINIVSSNEGDATLDWILGAFYLDTEIDVDFESFEDNDLNGAPLNTTPDLDNPFANPDQGFQTAATHSRESLSIFAQGTYYLSDAWSVTGGIRYTEDDFSSRVCNFYCETAFGGGVLGPTFLATSTDKVTGKLGLNWHVNDDNLLYGSWSRGFKPGGTNLSFGIVVTETYVEEVVDAIELGLKSQLLDNRLQVNTSVFWYDYKDFQFQATDPVPFSGGVANIPESEVFGVEVELSALLGDDWRLDANMAFLDSEIAGDFMALDNVVGEDASIAAGFSPTSFDPANIAVRAAAVQNLNGNSLPKSPEFTSNLSLTYQHELNNWGDLVSSVQYTYRDGFDYRVFNNPARDRLDSYDIWSLNIALQPSDKPWNLALIVYNLADDDIAISRFTDNFGVTNTSEQFMAPRLIMLRAGYSF